MPDVWMKISQASAIFQKMKLEDVVAVLDVFQVSFKKNNSFEIKLQSLKFKHILTY
jgi:hypothetical protein